MGNKMNSLHSAPVSGALPYELAENIREKAAYNAPFGLLVTLDDDARVPDPRIIPISLSSFLWTR